jgi:hypothetical protein
MMTTNSSSGRLLRSMSKDNDKKGSQERHSNTPVAKGSKAQQQPQKQHKTYLQTTIGHKTETLTLAMPTKRKGDKDAKTTYNKPPQKQGKAAQSDPQQTKDSTNNKPTQKATNDANDANDTDTKDANNDRNTKDNTTKDNNNNAKTTKHGGQEQKDPIDNPKFASCNQYEALQEDGSIASKSTVQTGCRRAKEAEGTDNEDKDKDEDETITPAYQTRFDFCIDTEQAQEYVEEFYNKLQEVLNLLMEVDPTI